MVGSILNICWADDATRFNEIFPFRKSMLNHVAISHNILERALARDISNREKFIENEKC